MRRTAALGLATALTLFAAAPAAAVLSAEEREAGMWYMDRWNLDEIHAQGITGKGVTIAVIDGGINTQAPELQGADITVKGRWCAHPETGERPPADTPDVRIAAHGTSVTSMIVGNGVAFDGGLGTRGVAPDAEIWFYARDFYSNSPLWFDCDAAQPEESDTDLTIYTTTSFTIGDEPELIEDYLWSADAMAALDAIRNGADIVSVSSGTDAWEVWDAVAAEAIREGVVIVGGIPNPLDLFDGPDRFEGGLPAELNGVVAVNAVDADAQIISGPAVGRGSSLNTAVAAPGVGVLVPESGGVWGPAISRGTSFATPAVAGLLALGMQKNPGASAHQVLQAMLRTTPSEGLSEPVWDDMWYGYGIPKPLAMLEVDATLLPDENPLFVTDPADPRCNVLGQRPTSVADCFDWATSPLPEDVWPEAGADPVPESADPTGAPSAPATPDDEPHASPVADQGTSGGVNMVLVGGVLAALVVLGGTTGAILNRRRREAASPHGSLEK